MSTCANVTAVLRRGRIARLQITETVENDYNRRSRRSIASMSAEDSSTVYREHVGGQTTRPAVIVQHKRAHLAATPVDPAADLAYLKVLAESRARLMGSWREYQYDRAARQLIR